MLLVKIIALFQIILTAASQTFTSSASKFRILAPQFVCPKDEEAIVEKPDNTVITLQTAADVQLDIQWTVRWTPLVAPTQRFTLLLWRTVRSLEKHLNKPQPEPFVYVIENSELLPGVNYIFNVTEVDDETNGVQPKTFNIDNTQGEQKLMIEGRNDMLSIVLLGAQTANGDAMFGIEAQVTTCYPTQDYYFSWTVLSLDVGVSETNFNLSDVHGSMLEIPPFLLKAGSIYNINCKVIKHSNGNLITQAGLPFKVSHRGLYAYINVDYLIVPANHTFSIESVVINHDYYDIPLKYKWRITFQDEDYNGIDNTEAAILTFPHGLSLIGEYEVFLTVVVLDQKSETRATISVVRNKLPILQIHPVPRLLNEGSELTIVANASNLTPTCTLSWHFITNENDTFDTINNSSCIECQHGEQLSELLTVFSLEEQFLNELADYTNDTEWRQVGVALTAKAGRARFVSQCGCSLTFSCDTFGTAYADITFTINESPKAGAVMISPSTGTALETVFRISTLAVSDPDIPLQYSFYCKVGDEKPLLLASYFEHRAVECLLPYTARGVEVWAEVCDALGACSIGEIKKLNLLPGEGRTLETLIEDAKAHARRCELRTLQRVAVSTIVTFVNTQQLSALTKFSEALSESMSAIHKSCIELESVAYTDLLLFQEAYGIATSRNNIDN